MESCKNLLGYIMDLTKLGYFANFLLKFILLLIFILIWFFDYFEGAFEEFESKATTTVVRNEGLEHLVSPTILICSNTAFKPSIAKKHQFDYPLKDLFWHLQDNPQVSNLFRNHSVPELFHNFSYAHDLTFSTGGYMYEQGINHIVDEGGEELGVVELNIIPTVFLGTCHMIDVLHCEGYFITSYYLHIIEIQLCFCKFFPTLK